MNRLSRRNLRARKCSVSYLGTFTEAFRTFRCNTGLSSRFIIINHPLVYLLKLSLLFFVMILTLIILISLILTAWGVYMNVVAVQVGWTSNLVVVSSVAAIIVFKTSHIRVGNVFRI